MKAVLLHEGNEHPSVPITHAHEMNESYETMKTLLAAFDICGDLKVICLLLRLQLGYTKHMCFLCLWDSRSDTKHYTQNDCPNRLKDLNGRFNCLHKSVVDAEKVFL